MDQVRPLRLSAAIGFCLATLGVSGPSAASSHRLNVGRGLSIVVPAGWHLTRKRFTPCTDPIERFSIIQGERVLMLQERLVPDLAELKGRPTHFHVRGTPSPIECCSLPGRHGWLLQFSDHGRAFYAYLYPGAGTVEPLLKTLDTLRVQGAGSAGFGFFKGIGRPLAPSSASREIEAREVVRAARGVPPRA